MESSSSSPQLYETSDQRSDELVRPKCSQQHEHSLQVLGRLYASGEFGEEAVEAARSVLCENPYNTLAFYALYMHVVSLNTFEAAEAELASTQKMLCGQPKNFQQWQHLLNLTEWLISHALVEDRRRFAESLLSFCQNVFNQDARNYHCWDFRTSVIRLLQRDLDLNSLFEETAHWIESDPLNASYFNHRWFLFRLRASNDCAAEAAYIQQLASVHARFEHGWNYLNLLAEYSADKQLNRSIYAFALGSIESAGEINHFALYSACEMIVRGYGSREDVAAYLERAGPHGALFHEVLRPTE